MSIHRLSTIGRHLLLLVGAVVLLTACATEGTGTQQASPTATGAAVFHTSLKTTDNQYLVQFGVTPDRLGLNFFTVGVQDAQSGKPVPSLHVQLTTTMLDMDMGTDQIDLLPTGPGQYSAQGSLSMVGHWEIRLLLRTPNSILHQTSVKLDTLA